MKKMKRLVAVLLAGIMTLAMLTACGGGSSTPTSDVDKAEALYMDAYNAALGTDYKNDAELKKLAKTVLDRYEEGRQGLDSCHDSCTAGKQKCPLRYYQRGAGCKQGQSDC